MVETNQQPPNIMYLGETGGEQFAQPFLWLQQRAKVQVARDMAEVRNFFSHLRPLIAVLAYRYPGEFPAGTDDQLMQLFPLCRVIHLLGEWCDGELRGDRPSPGTIWMASHQWRAKFESDWDLWKRGECPSWGKAPTVLVSERFSVNYSVRRRRAGTSVGIVTACSETRSVLFDAVEAFGIHARVVSNLDSDEATGLSLVLWDEARSPRSEPFPLRDVVDRVAPVPVIALSSFSRGPDNDAVQEAGAVTCLAKPYFLNDLSRLLYRYIPGTMAESIADIPAA